MNEICDLEIIKPPYGLSRRALLKSLLGLGGATVTGFWPADCAGAEAVTPPHSGRSLEIELGWQWKKMRDVMMAGLRDCVDRAKEPRVFNDIREQQKHNPSVYNSYGDCHTNDPKSFWEGVAMAAPRAVWNPMGVTTFLDWQWAHNRSSIKRAQDASVKTHPFSRPNAMYFLMEGQDQNECAQWVYRAAYRDDPEWFWGKINSYR